ncbi:hypothetical protein QBC34DRAFT_61639 [Podospora aff. communis PSN243]|uniref:Uncharacterized protein n=1 Tax=Podospora aff. communis PSN243 TaxID=3040156 RepID=A0AAV9GSU7_9PEZI|nr:hypothetical protein QBC34DRAFT_61639 [Podospora aff. communis PSN243]
MADITDGGPKNPGRSWRSGTDSVSAWARSEAWHFAGDPGKKDHVEIRLAMTRQSCDLNTTSPISGSTLTTPERPCGGGVLRRSGCPALPSPRCKQAPGGVVAWGTIDAQSKELCHLFVKVARSDGWGSLGLAVVLSGSILLCGECDGQREGFASCARVVSVCVLTHLAESELDPGRSAASYHSCEPSQTIDLASGCHAGM